MAWNGCVADRDREREYYLQCALIDFTLMKLNYISGGGVGGWGTKGGRCPDGFRSVNLPVKENLHSTRVLGRDLIYTERS